MNKKLITFTLAALLLSSVPATASAARSTSYVLNSGQLCPTSQAAASRTATSFSFGRITIGQANQSITILPCKTSSVKPSQAVPATPAPTKTPAATASPAPTSPDYTQAACSAQAQELARLINYERGRAGLKALTLDTQLCGAAALKSQDMYENNYFAHESPTYGNASSMLKKLGISVSAVGENIAKHATIEKSHAAFMTSEGHRKNILSSSWTKMGIGVKQANGYVLVTEIFAR